VAHPLPLSGKSADIIAVAGDPLTDIRVLESVASVMKEGTVYKQGGHPLR
jgi:imidazolonepropionase-like amidohydrolase